MSDKKPFKISGIGCALVDYLYKPINFSNPKTKKYFSKISGDGGLAPGKLVFKEEFEKFVGESYLDARALITNEMDPVTINIGGPSIVSLIHAAQMLKSSTVDVFFYGSRGADQAGLYMEEQILKTPLKTGKYIQSELYTPFTDVLSDPSYDKGNGERIFINNVGAAWDLLSKDIDEVFYDSDIVVFGGTALVPNIHAHLTQLLKKAKDRGAITVVNTVYDFLNEKANPDKAWPLGNSNRSYIYTDLLITDMEEALRLSNTKRVDDAVKFFKFSGLGSLIITHNSNPIYYYADNFLFANVPLRTMPVSARVSSELQTDEGKCGDTTGCGDNFVGGVISSIAAQLIENPGSKINLENAIAMGVASGGYACFYNGGTYYESFDGQKKGIVDQYYNDYLVQIGLSKNEHDK